jgi:putative Holliday junction resolvase
MRSLGIDHGEKRIGIAVTDPTGTLARPLTIVLHSSKTNDIARILELATAHAVDLIVVGQSTDEAGRPNLAGRRALRFAESLRAATGIPVILWDESLSTQDARATRIETGASRKRRARAVDSLAAAIMLQSFLDSGGTGDVNDQGPQHA